MHEPLFLLDAAAGSGGAAPPAASADAPAAPAEPGAGSPAPSPAAAAPAAGPGAAAPGGLLARGAGAAPPAPSPAPAAGAPAATATNIPEKYIVKKEDGSTDWEASALKQHADGYAPLLAKLHGGEAPPKSPDEYAPEVPQGFDMAALKADPLYTGFVKGAHALGINNKQLSYILGGWAEREALRNSPEAGEAELRKVWSSDDALQQGLAKAYRATAAYAGDDATRQRLEAKFSNDPDFIRLMARIGNELEEDRPVGGLNANEAETLDSLMKGPAYFDAKHPDHARVVARAQQLYAKKFPD